MSRIGCVSGLINSLVWYSDTHAFYDRHYDEIEDLRMEWEASTGVPIRIEGDLKNTLSWFAFERVADEIGEELRLE